MVSSKREKILALTLGGAMALLAADSWVLTPYLAERDGVSTELDLVTNELHHADRLLRNQRRVQQSWRELMADGLETDAAAAESKALHALRDFAQSSRVELQSLKTERATRSGDFLQIRLQATGVANTAALGRFMRQIETTKAPLRVVELRANSRRDGMDDVTFGLTIATLVFSPPPPNGRQAARTSARGDAR